MKMEPNSANLRAAVAFPIIRGGFFLETFFISFLPSPKVKQKIYPNYISCECLLKSTTVYDSVNPNNLQRRLCPDPSAEYENEIF